MIRLPPPFQATLEGDTLILESPGDDLLLCYTERLRPVVSIEELWGQEMPSLGPPELLVTDEGEYAWLVEGQRDDQRGHLTRFLGAVVGDDFLAVLEATTTTPGRCTEVGDLFEELLRTDSHMLGKRRRPYWHEAPAGWTVEFHSPFYTYYRALGADATIYVAPAIPNTCVAEGSLFVSLGLFDDRTTTAVHARLSGTWSSASRGDRHLEAFVLGDTDYFYAAVADAAHGMWDQATSALLAILGSVEGLPRSQTTKCPAVAVWAVD